MIRFVNFDRQSYRIEHIITDIIFAVNRKSKKIPDTAGYPGKFGMMYISLRNFQRIR